MLLERKMRGDLIETYKICNGLVDYGKNIVCHSFRALLRILKDKREDSVLTNLFENYWNKLPIRVETIREEEVDIQCFKSWLAKYKMDNFSKPGQY